MTSDQIFHVSDSENLAQRCEHLLQEICSTPRTPKVGEVRQLARGVPAPGDVERPALRQAERMCTFQDEARAHFQDLLARQGVTSEEPVELTVCIQPYWLRPDYPFASYQSGATRQCSKGVAVIGAGLSGALAA